MDADKLTANALGSLIGVTAIGAAAQISIPLPESFAVAPITGQSLAVLMAAHLLRWKWGSICILIYIIVGALGAPIFSNFSGGSEIAFGPSAGYLLGFLIAAGVVGKLAEIQKSKFPFLFIANVHWYLNYSCHWYVRFIKIYGRKRGIFKGSPPLLTWRIGKNYFSCYIIISYSTF